MKIILTIVLLMVTVVLCEKFEDKLFPPLSWIFALWKKFSHGLGIVMSSIILSLLWIIGIGSYAILYKIGRLFRRKPSQDTYWISVPSDKENNLRYQF